MQCSLGQYQMCYAVVIIGSKCCTVNCQVPTSIAILLCQQDLIKVLTIMILVTGQPVTLVMLLVCQQDLAELSILKMLVM